MKLMINIMQVQEELKLKARLMRPALEVMLKEQQAKKLIDTEKITLGFFYMFIYKDFALRELITIALRVKVEEANEVSE